MKTLVRVLPILLLFAACQSNESPELENLYAKRDSLLEVQLETQKELNEVEKQIALLDSKTNKNDRKILKKITMQKNKIASIQLKIKELEGEMTLEKKNNVTPVAVKKMKMEEFDHYIKVYGKVEAENYARISPEMGGKIEQIYVNEGQWVSKGELLVSLNTSAIERQIEGIMSTLDLATKTFEKQESLWSQGIGSEIQYLGSKNNKDNLESQLKALQAQKKMAQLRAPFDGIVDKIYSKKGELASPGFPVVEFVNLSKISITADIPEKYIAEVKKGQEVEVSFSSLDKVIKTPVMRISEVIDPKSRTFEIEINVPNAGGLIKPNMVSTIKINDFATESAFVVPSLVMRKDITGDYVYVVEEEEGKDVVRKKYVTPGMSSDDKTHIIEGLDVGDLVIVKGYHLVSSGIPVDVKE